ncbi:hypothetical protein [Chryseobacterium indoltheticum]|uniref:hypothetical protein n=1 Tax=Chryseobacterium indoltheticum TaxID=254 RepID=UPI003F491FED
MEEKNETPDYEILKKQWAEQVKNNTVAQDFLSPYNEMDYENFYNQYAMSKKPQPCSMRKCIENVTSKDGINGLRPLVSTFRLFSRKNFLISSVVGERVNSSLTAWKFVMTSAFWNKIL